MPPPKPHYRAFISYSHRDAKWAKWLHRSLERYVVPIDAFAPEDRLEKDGSKRSRRLKPVFRDRDELSVSGSLADAIRVALESSENLIVLCSPDSAKSQYVNSEIELFRSLHPDNDKKIYALIVEGEPPECFPPVLTVGGIEPIAADAREEGDGKSDAKLKLIAGMLGVGFDRLKRRAAKRQRNRLLVMVALVSAVAVMTTALAVRATRAEHKANIQEKASRARVLAATEPVKALALALDTAEEEQALKGTVSAPVMSSLLHTLETGRETAFYSSGSLYEIIDCVPSPDGTLIAYTSPNGVYVVDRSSGLIREIFRGPEEAPVRRIAFGPKGKLMVLGDAQGKLIMLRIDGQKVLWERQAYAGSVNGLAWLASTGQIVSCEGGGLIRFWTGEGEQAAPDLTLPVGSVGAFAVRPDGKSAAAAASEMAAGNGAWMIDFKSGKTTKLKTGDDVLHALVFDSSGSRLAGAGLDRVIQFWDHQGQPLGGTIRTAHEGAINSLAFHPFEPLIVSGSEDGTLRVYTESGNLAFAPLHGHTKAIRSISFDPVGLNAVSAAEDGSVRTWDFNGLQAAAPIRVGINSRVLLFHPDGTRLAAGSMDGKIRFYAYPSGELLRTIEAHAGPCNLLEPLPDGSGFASTASEVNEVKFFSWEGESDGAVFRDPGGRIHVIAAHPRDPVLFVVGSSGELYQLALPSLSVLRQDSFSGKDGGVDWHSGLAVLPESGALLLRANTVISIRGIENPAKLSAQEGSLQSAYLQKFRFALSPDRKLVLTGGHLETGRSVLNLYRLPELERIGEIELPWDAVHIASISHSGREVSLVSKEGKLQFLSLKGEAIGPVLRAHGHDPRGFALHPKEEVLATTGGDGWIRFWNFGEEAWMRTARIRLGRSKASSARTTSLLARTASSLLSRKPNSEGRSIDGRVVFPEAGISLKIPQGWAQFDPRALALFERLVAAAGSVDAKRVKMRGAFSRGDEVQFRIFGAPNFYIGTAEEFRGAESFAKQLPEFQDKLQGLANKQSRKLGLASDIVFGKPQWNADLHAFVFEGGGKSSDGSLIRMKAWFVPTQSHTVAIICFGDSILAREVEAIMQSIEIDEAIAPGEEEYARAEETLEAALTSYEQNVTRRRESKQDLKRFLALHKKWNEEQRSGKIDQALSTCSEALVLMNKWTQKSDPKSGEMVIVDWANFSLYEVAALHGMATLYIINKDADSAKKVANQAMDLLEGYRRVLSDRDATNFHHMEALCSQDLCRVAEMQKNYPTAVDWMKISVAAHRMKIKTDSKKDAAKLITLANAIALLGEMQRKNGEYTAAVSSAKQAIKVAKSMPESVRSKYWAKAVSGYYRVIASASQSAGKGEEGIAAAKNSLAFVEDSRSAFSNDPRFRWEVDAARYRVMNAILHHDKDRWREVIELLRMGNEELASIREVAEEGDLKGIDIQRIEGDRRRFLALQLWDRAAVTKKEGGSPVEELSYLDQAVIEVEEAARLSPGKRADDYLQTVYHKRGDFYIRAGKHKESAGDLAKQIAALRRQASRDEAVERKLSLALALNSWASTREKVGELDEAQPAIDEALKILESVVGAKPEDFRAKGYLISVSNVAIRVATKIKDPESVQSLRARRMVLAEDLMAREDVGAQPLTQAFYAYSGDANYQRYGKIGEPEEWIALYEKAIEVTDRIQETAQLSDNIRKSLEICVSAIKELRASEAK